MALHDLDGNRLRIGQAARTTDVDTELGTDTVATLRELETAMWEDRHTLGSSVDGAASHR